MEITTIPYSETNYFSETVKKYLSKDETLRPFYSVFPEKDKLLHHALSKDFSQEKRESLVSILKEQANGKLSPKQEENLELLKKDKTFTVTTGHQICLFGGPLYFFLKIISTINLAKELNDNSKNLRFVPIYWMATEDHDFEEVNHINLFGKKIEWKRDFGQHVGDMDMNSISEFKKELFEVLGDSENARELKTIFEKSYSIDRSFAQGTRNFVNHFFAEYGLLVMDANDDRLKSSFLEVMLSDIESSTFNIVQETNEKLEKEIKIQANPSDVNLFVLNKEQRLKIRREEEKFRVGDELIELVDLKEGINNSPEKYSPNVLLRPLYQEMVLPNIAYIGGGGELAYWLELKALFEFHKVQFPSLVLRNSLLWVDRTSSKKMNALGVNISDLFQREDNLIKAFSKNLLSEDQNLNEEKISLGELFAEIVAKMKSVDPTLENSALGEQKNMLKTIEKLESKILKSIKNKNEVQLIQLRKLKQKLFPNDSLQERSENFASLYLRQGREFIEILMNNLDPFAFEFTVIKEDS